MRIVSYENEGEWVPGLLIDGTVVDTAAAARLADWSADRRRAAGTNRGLLALGVDAVRALHDAAADAMGRMRAQGAAFDAGAVRLGPPVADPRKIVCFGLNYHDHAQEVGAEPPAAPIFFAKYDNSLAGASDDIVPPRETEKVDYEAELAVVIGRRGRYIAEADALEHVFGAMAFNDVSARDLQLANHLWTGGKAVDTFAPCGPALVSRDELGDLQELGVRTRVDGELVQDGTTASMIFPIARLVSFLSRIMTLEPGDVIATGTPAGVGGSRKPPLFLQTGSLVEVEIERIGTLRNRVAPPPEPEAGKDAG